jgi:hypothetical protein
MVKGLPQKKRRPLSLIDCNEESLDRFNRGEIKRIRLLHELDLSWSILMQESSRIRTFRGLSLPPNTPTAGLPRHPPGEAGMAHCGVEGEVGATARRV